MTPQPTTSASTSPFRQSPLPHLHIYSETCPWCEQEIPPEKLQEISGKIAARERQQADAITAKLEQQFTIDKAQADAKAKADLELERQYSAARETAAREESRKATEAAAAERLAEAERSRQEMHAKLQQQAAQTEAARVSAEQTSASLQSQLQQLHQDSEMALAAAKAEAKAKEGEIHAEAQQVARAAMKEQLAAIESARLQSEAALQARITEIEETKAAAQQQGVALQLQLDEMQKVKDAEVAKVREDAAAAAIRVRQEATEAVEALLRDRSAEKDKALAEAQAKSAEAEGKLAKLSEQYELALNERLNSQREILERAKDDAINGARAKAFEETQKLSNKVTELQRALENKTAEELGEGAEVNLFEALKKEFPDDRIQRVAKGAPGADVHHVVLHNGRECGTIIYDSKNHKAFRNEHVAKLVEDQIAARAEHAILSTHKFPQGARQLHMQDGVLLANPARVVMVVAIIRQHLLQTQNLRLSGAERQDKAAALYAFITSERCTQLLGRVDAHTDELLDHQVKEKKWHETAWKKQGEALRSIQKAKAELSTEISYILGTAPDDAL
jgi:hypothetical protein